MLKIAEFTERNREKSFCSLKQFLDNIGYSNTFDDGRFSAEIGPEQVVICQDNQLDIKPISSVKDGIIKAYEAYLAFNLID